MVSADRESSIQRSTEVSEEELQSEAELIRSRDLLGKVVVACDLQASGGGFAGAGKEAKRKSENCACR